MKKSLLLFALVLGLLPSLFAQEAKATTLTADEIASNYIEAIGGADAWKAAKNVRMSGKMAMMGMEMPMTVTMASPNLMRIDVDIMGQKMIQSFDGETPWQVMPMMGINKPTKMAEAEAKQVNQSELVPEFIDYAERGYQIELVDAREIEGVATQGVRIFDDADKDMTYYFDLENFVPIMMEVTVKEGEMKGTSIESFFSDYEEVDGLIIAHFIELKTPQGSQKMIFDKTEVNAELEDKLFSMPE